MYTHLAHEIVLWHLWRGHYPQSIPLLPMPSIQTVDLHDWKVQNRGHQMIMSSIPPTLSPPNSRESPSLFHHNRYLTSLQKKLWAPRQHGCHFFTKSLHDMFIMWIKLPPPLNELFLTSRSCRCWTNVPLMCVFWLHCTLMRWRHYTTNFGCVLNNIWVSTVVIKL